MTTKNDRSTASLAAVICLLAVFAILSRSAALTKSATRDETLHAAAGWSYVHTHDWRANPELPPLTKIWSALHHDPLDLQASTSSMAWRAMLANPRWQWNWAAAAVFRSPYVTGDAFVQRARLPMLAFGVALGALIAAWAWRIGGATAALCALALYSFSPGFLGHASLVTSDVPLAFAWLSVAFTAWWLGERISLARIALLGTAVACATLVSFSGLLAIPLVAGLLTLRAAENRPWLAGRTELARPATRAAAAVVILLQVLVLCWALIWCAYGLRFSATADETPLDLAAATAQVAEQKLRDAAPGRDAPSSEEIAAYPHGASVRFALFSQGHGLLPEAWNRGLLAPEGSIAPNKVFLLGKVTQRASWIHIPVAMLFKAPAAAIAAVLAAIALASLWLRRDEIDLARHSWLTWCLAVPPTAYAVVLMASGASAGIRLAFPLLPFVMIAAGLVAARAIRVHGHPARRAAMILALILAIESLVAWPNYIAFFNVAAGGPRGGVRLLGESNLDWGQDLKLLASWQAANPGERLYLVYDGSADPTGYGIRYVNAFGAYPFGPRRGPIDAPGVLAISATTLQGTRSLPELEPILAELKRTEPLAVLGGSIYLYRVTPRG
ncbi:MAG: hypothetical protein NDJ92_10080 [Thermoanaerobaculia bacterium]|nr:hypothetical protein [Thermoanaerobaculia bacterium]